MGQNRLFTWGSSPRMRGALIRLVNRVAVDGIIPAYAGSTEMRRNENMNEMDHPRVCGEHA